MSDDENKVVWDRADLRRVRDGSRIKSGTVLRFPDERSPSPLAEKLVIYGGYIGPMDIPNIGREPHFAFEVEGVDGPLTLAPSDLVKMKMIEVR